jgi:hypothetical protein
MKEIIISPEKAAHKHALKLAAQARWRKSARGIASRSKYQTYYNSTPKRKEYEARYGKTEHAKTLKKANILKNKYGMSVEAFNKMLQDQMGVCAIGGGVEVRGGRLHVDHSHNTGKVRGLLCHKCNVAIGLLKDSTEVILKAYSYIQERGV